MDSAQDTDHHLIAFHILSRVQLSLKELKGLLSRGSLDLPKWEKQKTFPSVSQNTLITQAF